MADQSPIGTKREASTPKESSKSPKKPRIDPSSPMDISPESVNTVSKFLKVGGGLHYEEMKGFAFDNAILEIDSFPTIVQAIFSEDAASKTEAAIKLKLLVSKGHMLPIVFAVEANLIPKLVSFIEEANSPNLQYMSTSILADISLGGKNMQVLLENNVIHAMTNVLCRQDIKSNSTKEEAIRALGNIAGESTETRFLVIEAALKPLLDLYLMMTSVGSDNISLNNMIKWTLIMLYNGTAPKDLPYQSIITVAKELLLSQVSGHKEVACRTLNFITKNNCEKVRLAIIQEESIISSVGNMLHLQANYTISALKTLPIIMSSDLYQKVLPCLYKFLQSKDETIVREVCNTIVRLTGTYAQQIIASGIVNALLSVSTASQQSEEIRKLALSTISIVTDPDGKVEKAGSLEFSETTVSEDEGSEASEFATKDED